MGYEATTGVIMYWKSYQPFVTHRAYHVWFDEYNSCLYIEDKHAPGSLLLLQDTESHIHNPELLSLILCELNLTSTPFFIQKFSHFKLSCLPLERKLVLIYWMMNLSQSHIYH